MENAIPVAVITSQGYLTCRYDNSRQLWDLKGKTSMWNVKDAAGAEKYSSSGRAMQLTKGGAVRKSLACIRSTITATALHNCN